MSPTSDHKRFMRRSRIIGAVVVLAGAIFALALPPAAAAQDQQRLVPTTASSCGEVFAAQESTWAEITATLVAISEAPVGGNALNDELRRLHTDADNLLKRHVELDCNTHLAGHGPDDPLWQLNTAGGIQITLERLRLERVLAFRDLAELFDMGEEFGDLAWRVRLIDYAMANARARQTRLLRLLGRPYQVPVNPLYAVWDVDTARRDELLMKRRELQFVIAQQSAQGIDGAEWVLVMQAVEYLLAELAESYGTSSPGG